MKKKLKKKIKVRIKAFGSKERPRLSVFRSNRFIYAQLIDDGLGKTILGLSEKHLSKDQLALGRLEKAAKLGNLLAKKAKALKIKKVIFDRRSYRYHGRIKALAQGAREGGLEF